MTRSTEKTRTIAHRGSQPRTICNCNLSQMLHKHLATHAKGNESHTSLRKMEALRRKVHSRIFVRTHTHVRLRSNSYIIPTSLSASGNESEVIIRADSPRLLLTTAAKFTLNSRIYDKRASVITSSLRHAHEALAARATENNQHLRRHTTRGQNHPHSSHYDPSSSPTDLLISTARKPYNPPPHTHFNGVYRFHVPPYSLQ